MSVKRFDSGILQKHVATPQGGYMIPAAVTRVGVLPYRLTDGTVRRELREPAEVFSTDSLRSLAHAPVTDLHPPVPVTAVNWREFSIGHVAPDIRPEGTHVNTSLIVQDSEALAKIDNGERREVSCGYRCDLDETPGVWQGERYDAVQRNIRYNHVAIGPNGWGRAGSTVAMRLDAGDAVLDDGVTTMATIRIDGKDYDAGSPEAAAAVAKLQTERDKALGEAAADKAAADKLRKDAADKAAADKAAAAKASKTALIKQCKAVADKMGVKFDDAKAEGSDEGSILASIIALLDPSADVSGKSPDFIGGLAMGLIKAALQGPAADEAAEVAAGEVPPADAGTMPGMAGDSIFHAREGKPDTNRKDSEDDRYDSEKARKAMIDHSQNAWQKPLRMSRDSK